MGKCPTSVRKVVDLLQNFLLRCERAIIEFKINGVFVRPPSCRVTLASGVLTFRDMQPALAHTSRRPAHAWRTRGKGKRQGAFPPGPLFEKKQRPPVISVCNAS